MKTDKTQWQVVYKKVYKDDIGRYFSAHVHGTLAELQYEIGKVTKAKVGGIFCLPDKNALYGCPEGNAVLMVLARYEIKGPTRGFLGTNNYTLSALKKHWRPKRKTTFVRTYATVFYKEVLPVMELEL